MSIPLPPEIRLIEEKREAMYPRMSIRAAAARAGMAEATWRWWKSGKRSQGHCPAATLADMAFAVDALPEELEQAGRPDAAAALRHRMQRAAADAAIPDELRESALTASQEGLDGLLAEIVQGLQDINTSKGLTREQKAALRDELISAISHSVAQTRGNLRAVLHIARPGK